MNHHQKPFADKMYEILGDNFSWIATCPTDQERIKLGYEDLNEKLPYIICSYKDDFIQRNA